MRSSGKAFSVVWLLSVVVLLFGQLAVAQQIEILCMYGSEKKDWLTEVTKEYLATNPTVYGKPVVVKLKPMGSGEMITETLEGKQKPEDQPDLLSPASSVWVELGNYESNQKTSGPLLGPTVSLVQSPVVIAMWKPMAEAMGWPNQPLGWATIAETAMQKGYWASKGHPEWGEFKFGHTHPECSSSGLIALLGEVYGAADISTELTSEQLQKPRVGKLVGAIEGSVVHYGESTGFFGDKMAIYGPQYLSAAVVYESVVVSMNTNPKRPPAFPPIVALYPRDGSFMSDHPIGIVQRYWVTAERRQAAQNFIEFLRQPAQQAIASRYGFRRGGVGGGVGPVETSLAHPEWGIDPEKPEARWMRPIPPASVMNEVLALFRKLQKKANIVIAFDTSASMDDEVPFGYGTKSKLALAKEAAIHFVSRLNDQDRVSLISFNSRLHWETQGQLLWENRKTVNDAIQQMNAFSNTLLYDAVADGHTYLTENPAPDRINAVVVLTDGVDTGSRETLQSLLHRIDTLGDQTPGASGAARPNIRVFTIGYGLPQLQPEEQVRARRELRMIAEATQEDFYEASPNEKSTEDFIRKIFDKIIRFF